MRKFTLTAIAIKDEKVAGVFQILEQTPKFDGALLSHALSKFVELPYQKLVFDPSKIVFVDLHWLHSNFGKLSVEELAFSVWRAATALRNSKALEVEGVKHGSNWLVRLDDEPFDVKFVLEDQAQNYLILNVLPLLEPTVAINESGWLHNNVEDQPTVQLGFVTTGCCPVTEETVEVVQLDEDTKRDPNALLSAAPQCTETGIRDSSQLPNRYSEQIVEPGQESMPGFKFSSEFGDKGVVAQPNPGIGSTSDKNVDMLVSLTRAKEMADDMAALSAASNNDRTIGSIVSLDLSPTKIADALILEYVDDKKLEASMHNGGVEPPRISSVGVHMQMKKEFEFSQEDPGPTEILAAFKQGYLDGAKTTALDPGMFEKPISEGFAEGLSEVLEQVDKSRSASKALLSDEQEGLLAETSLFGQNAAIVILDEPPYIPSEEVREAAKAVGLESNPVYNHYENGSDIPTNHTELNNPTLEI